MATENVEIELAPFKMVIEFKLVGNDIQVHKVKARVGGSEEDIDAKFGIPPGTTYPLGSLLKYKTNPTCIGFVMGGSYYEICF